MKTRKKQTLDAEEKSWDTLYTQGSLMQVGNFPQFAEGLKEASKNTDR